jgi:hypothetical protein
MSRAAPDDDEVVPLDVPWIPDGAVSGAVLEQTEFGGATLAFRVAPIAPTTEPFAVMVFPQCLATYFGHPNDEAQPGHRLYERGLFASGAAAYEVLLRPSWLEELRLMNAVMFPEPSDLDEQERWPPGRYRHFVVPFKESTFECLATDLTGYFSANPRPAFLNPWRDRVPPTEPGG